MFYFHPTGRKKNLGMVRFSKMTTHKLWRLFLITFYLQDSVCNFFPLRLKIKEIVIFES